MVARMGLDSGRMILKKIVPRFAPSMVAASSMSLGMDSM